MSSNCQILIVLSYELEAILFSLILIIEHILFSCPINSDNSSVIYLTVDYLFDSLDYLN